MKVLASLLRAFYYYRSWRKGDCKRNFRFWK